MSFLDDIFNPSGDENKRLLDKTLAQQQKLRKEGNRDYRLAYDQGIGYLDQALDPMEDMSELGKEGIDYRNLLLMGGDEGVDAFNNSALKKISMQGAQQGLESLARFNNSKGLLDSGNMSIDAMNYMNTHNTGLWNQLIGATDPYFNLYGAGNSGQANAYNNMASLGMQRAGGISNNNNAMLQPISDWGAGHVANNGLGMQNALNAALGLANMFKFGAGGGAAQ